MAIVLTKTPEVLRDDIKKTVLPFLDSSDRGIIKTTAERAAAIGALLGIEKISGVERDKRTINHFLWKANKYGFNFHNRWKVEFENNVALNDNELDLLESYVSEFSEPTHDFTETNLHLGFRKHKDIQNIEHKEFSLSFFVDNKLIIKSIFSKILNKMKNLKTGKLGYRVDYKFDIITIKLFDNFGIEVFRYEFYNAIVKGLSDATFNHESASLQNKSITFEYDYMFLYSVTNGELIEIT